MGHERLSEAERPDSVNRDLAIDCKPLVVSPLVIMVWEDRAEAFENYYKDKGGITYANLYDALSDSKIVWGWTIAARRSVALSVGLGWSRPIG